MTDRGTTTSETRPDAESEQDAELEGDPQQAAASAPTSAPTSSPTTTDRPAEGKRLSTEDLATSGQRSGAGAGSAATTSGSAASEAALFDRAAADDLQSRWQAIQVEFVDEPRGAVEKADGLVAEVMQQLAESFAKERRELEAAWQGGREASTEDLRQAIRRYRSFFNRLLSV